MDPVPEFPKNALDTVSYSPRAPLGFWHGIKFRKVSPLEVIRAKPI